MTPQSEQATTDALKRIAMTADGRLFRLLLQRKLMSLAPVGDSGALLRFEGERRFASELIALMDEGLKAEPESARPDEPVSTVQRKPVASGARRGLSRRVSISGSE